MLDGIREGVQGVSRLLAAGLGELSSAASLPSPVSSSRSPGAPRQSHSTQTSSSSVSTYATTASKSARLSQSSASSLEDSSGELPAHEEVEEKGKRDQGVEVHVINGVGTPLTPSTNSVPAVHKPNCGQESCSNVSKSTRKTHRRMSRDTSQPLSPSLSSRSIDLSTTSPSSGSFKRTLKAKRMSGAALPLVASPTPVLGSLTAAGMSAGVQPSVSSWVGSVGKKWEEIQRASTYVKPIFAICIY